MPPAVVQDVLNSYWEKEQPGLPMRTNLSGVEIALLVIIATITVMVIIGSFIPE